MFRKASRPPFSELGDCAELVPLGAMAPLLDAGIGNTDGYARIKKRKDGLFVAEPEAVPRPATTSRLRRSRTETLTTGRPGGDEWSRGTLVGHKDGALLRP